MDAVNHICKGDLQKSVRRILGVALISQDMEGVMAAIGEEYTSGSYSANNEAPLATGYTPGVKSPVVTESIVAERITADSVAVDTAEAKVEYMGETELTTVRLTIACDVPVKEIVSQNDFEYNPATGAVIVYKSDGTAISNELFTIVFDLSTIIPDGTYPIDLTAIEVTDTETNKLDVGTRDGAVIIDNTVIKGDVNGDGEVDNRDLIMIARYLVDLVEFSAKQMEAADYNEDGVVDNKDLVLIARAIVAGAKPQRTS
jgi:hypothetical protein